MMCPLEAKKGWKEELLYTNVPFEAYGNILLQLTEETRKTLLIIFKTNKGLVQVQNGCWVIFFCQSDSHRNEFSASKERSVKECVCVYSCTCMRVCVRLCVHARNIEKQWETERSREVKGYIKCYVDCG
jgi:hypothetical protein